VRCCPLFQLPPLIATMYLVVGVVRVVGSRITYPLRGLCSVPCRIYSYIAVALHRTWCTNNMFVLSDSEVVCRPLRLIIGTADLPFGC